MQVKPSAIQIRPVQLNDSPRIAEIIRTVMPEFGASGPGFAIHDAEVNDMYTAYTQARCCYFVVTRDQNILGGGGIAPLAGSTEDICELRKMYFMPALRGGGAGHRLLDRCLEQAAIFGYKKCYLETLTHMHAAKALYQKHGFEKICAPLGATGHFSCDSFFIRALD